MRNLELIPGLPHDLAVRCLARVPRALCSTMRLVSYSWSVELRGSEVKRIRTSLGVKEDWIICCIQGFPTSSQMNYYAYSKDLNGWLKLNSKLDFSFVSNINTISKNLYAYSIPKRMSGSLYTDKVVRYDAFANAWKESRELIVDRREFVQGSDGHLLYFAGGKKENDTVMSAGCYNYATDEYLCLPDMIPHYFSRFGFCMNGKFYVWCENGPIQVYEPKLQVWKMVAAHKLHHAGIAVVQNVLYVVEIFFGNLQIRRYDSDTWTFSEVLTSVAFQESMTCCDFDDCIAIFPKKNGKFMSFFFTWNAISRFWSLVNVDKQVCKSNGSLFFGGVTV